MNMLNTNRRKQIVTHTQGTYKGTHSYMKHILLYTHYDTIREARLMNFRWTYDGMCVNNKCFSVAAKN